MQLDIVTVMSFWKTCVCSLTLEKKWYSFQGSECGIWGSNGVLFIEMLWYKDILQSECFSWATNKLHLWDSHNGLQNSLCGLAIILWCISYIGHHSMV